MTVCCCSAPLQISSWFSESELRSFQLTYPVIPNTPSLSIRLLLRRYDALELRLELLVGPLEELDLFGVFALLRLALLLGTALDLITLGAQLRHLQQTIHKDVINTLGTVPMPSGTILHFCTVYFITFRHNHQLLHVRL